MAEPASGSVAASSAIAITSGGMFSLGALMPPGASLNEFVWGCIFSMGGAFAYSFIQAMAQRQEAADKNVPIDQRPTIDLVMLGYAICGAPMSCALLIFGIHQFHGATGFGDTTWFQSAAGFMVAGAAGPKMVIKAVALIVGLVSSRMGSIKP